MTEYDWSEQVRGNVTSTGVQRSVLPEGWIMQNAGGQVYYVNLLDGKSTWERPTQPAVNVLSMQELRDLLGRAADGIALRKQLEALKHLVEEPPCCVTSLTVARAEGDPLYEGMTIARMFEYITETAAGMSGTGGGSNKFWHPHFGLLAGRPPPEEGEDHHENWWSDLTSCRNTNVAEHGSGPV
eukprot:s2978_g2.t1